MVIIVIDGIGNGRATIARSLAVELGWRLADGDESPSVQALHDVIVRAIDRREHTVVACRAGGAIDHGRLPEELRPVRVVLLRTAAYRAPAKPLASPEGGDGRVLIVDGTWPPERILGTIREEFGV